MAERRSEVRLSSLSNTAKKHTYTRNAGVRSTQSHLPLERKRNSNLKSSYRNGTDAGRLESYWKYICEQEDNSKKRNKNLIEDFERIEQKVSILDAKTQKLKDLRDQYNSYIDKMYPRWLEELKHHRHVMQQERNGLPTQASRTQDKRPEGTTLPGGHILPRDFSRELGPRFRGSNHVRFISPEHSSLYQHEDASLYDSQHTRPQDQTSYYDQSSTQGYIDPTRYKTMEWDPYLRDPSFDYYHFGQVSSLRTPHGHVNQQGGNLLRFSTPYHPGHSGPLDPRNGFNQSFDMSYLSHGYERGPHPRHPDAGSPMMHQSPERLGYNENMRPAMPRQGGPSNPEAGVSYSTSFDEQDGPVRQPTQQQRSPTDREQSMSLAQSECHGSIRSASTSPYSRDPPEKPLELTADKKPVKPVQPVSSEKPRPPQDPQQASSDEYTTPSPLGQNDLQPVSNNDVGQGNGQTDNGIVDASKNEADAEDSEDDHPDLSEGSLSLSLAETSDISLPDIGEAKNATKTQEAHSEDIARKSSLADNPEDLQEEMHGKNDTKMPSLPSNAQQSREEETKTQGSHDGVKRKPSTEQSGLPNDVLRKSLLTDNFERSSPPQGTHVRADKGFKEKSSDEIKDNSSNISTDQKIKEQMTKPQENQEKIPKEDTKATENKQPSVTIPVLLTLLQVVDADIEVSFSPETIYRAPPCSQAMKEDIIRSAKSDDSSLDAYDPSSISMIILEELPLLVRTSPYGCLIQDQVLLSGETYSTPKKLRDVIEPALVPLWDSLLPHMSKLVEHNILAVDEAAKIFGNLLLKQDSNGLQKFQTLLINLIKGIISGEHENPPPKPSNDPAEPETSQKDDNHSLASDESSTLGSTPPIYDNDRPQSKEQSLDDPQRSLERTLSYEDDFEEDGVPLHKTAAYRKMMSSTHSHIDDLSDSQDKADPQGEEESEGDDDLERTLARSISPPPTSPGARSSANNKTPEEKKPGRQKPKLSLFGGGAGSLGLSYGSEDLGDSWGGDESGKLTSSWKSNATDKTASVVSDEDISPPSSPDLDLEPAYIPSAMVSGNKKEEPGKTNSKPATKVTRKPEFWNHSDTESEVDLQLSTGVVDAEDDDFDFYG